MRSLIISCLIFMASSASAKVDDFNTLIDEARDTRLEVQEQVQQRTIQSETSSEKAFIKDSPKMEKSVKMST